MSNHLRDLRSIGALLTFCACLLFASVLAMLGAATPPAEVSPTSPGMVDTARIDRTCAPCKDFYRFANGAWIKKTAIPSSDTWYGAWPMVRDRNELVLREIFEENAKAARRASTVPNTNAGRVGAFYASCTDSAAVDAAGVKPLQPTLDAIAAISSVDDLVRAFALRAGTPIAVAPFTITPAADPTNSSRMIASASQIVLSMGDRDLYLSDNDSSRSLRQRYPDHIRKTFELLGEKAAEASADAETVMALETELARVSVPPAAVRQASTRSNKMSITEFSDLTPHINWTSYLERVGGSSVKQINVLTPSYFAALDSVLVRVPLKDWKAFMRWRAAHSASPALGSAWFTEFQRGQAVLRGVSVDMPRPRLCNDLTLLSMGYGVGDEFVRRTFSPAGKARANAMLDNLVAAMRARIERLKWMSESTKRGALAKLDGMRRNIGYPDTWVDYSGVELRPNDFFGNLQRLDDFNQRRLWARVGKPADRTEWTANLPQTVSANYIVSANKLVVPAGILHPPFFDPDRDDPANYGAIGAIMAHEIAHAFDDLGRRFDEDGNVRNWWAPEDEAKYRESTQPLVPQFNAYTVLDSATHLNGALTLIENVADLLGCSVAYEAMERAFRGKEQIKIEGFTPAQRFFLAYAQMWGEVRRPEALREQVRRDAHAPAQWRVNGTLSNLPEFRRAWGCNEGDPMVEPAERRVTIW